MKEKLLSNLLNQKSIQSLFEFFDNESKEIFLVGGCVRDAFFGKISRDMDVAANAFIWPLVSALRVILNRVASLSLSGDTIGGAEGIGMSLLQ